MTAKIRIMALAVFVVLSVIVFQNTGWAVENNRIWIGNTPVLTIRTAAGGMDVAQRVDDLQQRTNDLLLFGRYMPKFTTMRSGSDVNIYAEKELYMTVTEDDARVNNTTPERLAKYWIMRIESSIPHTISLYSPSGVAPRKERVPDNTVISVILNEQISSETSKVADNFYAYQMDTKGGFPENTRFTGRVDSVTKASRNHAGEIAISFVSAMLPDGSRLPITGKLVSLDRHSVKTDMISNRLVSKQSASRVHNKFVAYGQGAGLAIGQTLGNRQFLGAVVGVGRGDMYGKQQITPAVGRDVQVPAGTEFGILLCNTATLTDVAK